MKHHQNQLHNGLFVMFLICTLKLRSNKIAVRLLVLSRFFFIIVRLYERQHWDVLIDVTAVPPCSILVSSTLVMTKLFKNATAKWNIHNTVEISFTSVIFLNIEEQKWIGLDFVNLDLTFIKETKTRPWYCIWYFFFN